MSKLKAWIKYVLSFLKSEWNLNDYPISVKHQKVDPSETHGRLRPIPYTAQIVNWWMMSGHGDTKEEALAELEKRFQQYKAEHSPPRPGTKVPMAIELAPSSKIDLYEHIARKFFREILEMNHDECLVTDESSLWDFHMDETSDALNKKIRDVYQVDVSDIESGNLIEIYERIELLSNNY